MKPLIIHCNFHGMENLKEKTSCGRCILGRIIIRFHFGLILVITIPIIRLVAFIPENMGDLRRIRLIMGDFSLPARIIWKHIGWILTIPMGHLIMCDRMNTLEIMQSWRTQVGDV